MTVSMHVLDLLADETHRAAEDHWRRHGGVPTKTLLLSAQGVPTMVDLPTGDTLADAEVRIAGHAVRIQAAAIVLTSVARLSTPSTGPGALKHLTLADLPQADDDRHSSQAILTIACKQGGEATARVSVIDTKSDGSRVLGDSSSVQPLTLAAAEGTVAWLSALLPSRH